jgi:hypothetical protein
MNEETVDLMEDGVDFLLLATEAEPFCLFIVYIASEVVVKDNVYLHYK